MPVTSVIKSTKLPSRLDYRVCPLLLLALDSSIQGLAGGPNLRKVTENDKALGKDHSALISALAVLQLGSRLSSFFHT